MEIKLLDCPFCGGQAELALYTHNKISNGVAVQCTRCGGSTTRIIYRHNDIEFPAVVKRMQDHQAEAAKLWNKRFELK
jgi:Lar family restriction alleviation protein